MSNKISYLSLIKKFKIEIPIIQRDYAQGRNDNKINEIRKSFIDDIFESILVKREPIDFDFIYGYIKQDISNNEVFIPLDGQQRITTLFLLYIFIANKENRIVEVKDFLLNFTYKTRYTSRDFCIELAKNEIIFSDYSKEEKISDIILDSSWFFLSWKKDPTIKSMLVMLDTIQQKFNDCHDIFDILMNEEEPPFIFQYIELKDFGLTDDLYIKMNARGKILTDFENFKARLEQHIEKEYPNILPEFNKNIDNSWTDFFWEFRDDKNSIDNQFYNFFKNIALNNYASKYDVENTSYYDYLENLNILSSNNNVNFTTYKKLECFDENSISNILKILNTIKASNREYNHLIEVDILNDSSLFKALFTRTLTREERLYFYAYTMFISVNKNLNGFNNWMRVIRNLIESTFYNRDDDYRKSILSIKKMLPFSNDILNYIKDNEITGFLSEQVKEEAIKAKLILKNKEWENEIKTIENQGYFKGQISFLLKFSGINELHDNIGRDFNNDLIDSYFDSFVNYRTKTQLLFDINGLKTLKNNLVERALLTFGNYTIDKGRNKSFLKNDDRDISWRRFLRNETKNVFYKKLLDKISINSYTEDLKLIITNFNNENSWRYNFVKYSELIDACGKNRFLRWSSEGKSILLLENNTTFGYHYEYYSYALCIKLRNVYDAKVSYEQDKSVDFLKFISKINNHDIEISFDDYEKGYEYLVIIENNRNYFKEEKEVINFLKNSNII
jgi:hypothetical protein